MRRNITGIAAVLCVVAGTAYAAPDSARRPCTNADIVGTWNMTAINANFKYDPNNAWYFPYQIMRFGADGSLRHWTGNKPPDGLTMKLLDAMPQNQTYTLDDSTGHLLTINPAAKTSTPYTCAIYTADSGNAKKGDVWIGAGQPGGSLVIKVLQKSQ